MQRASHSAKLLLSSGIASLTVAIVRLRVYEMKGGLRSTRGPKVFKSIRENATTQGNDGIGSAYGPAHSRLFQTLTDYRAAACLDHTGAHKELLFTIFGIAHLRRIVLEVAQLFDHRLFAFSGGRQLFAGLAKKPVDVARFQPIPPGFRRFGLWPPENLREGGQ